jgi:hypothetical protein
MCRRRGQKGEGRILSTIVVSWGSLILVGSCSVGLLTALLCARPGHADLLCSAAGRGIGQETSQSRATEQG